MHNIQIGAGELVDRLVIMELKYQAAPEKLQGSMRTQLQELGDIYHHLTEKEPLIDVLRLQLSRVNKKLWLLEDEIRCDTHCDKSQVSVEIAITNDIRSRIKYEIDLIAGDNSTEFKSYGAMYSQDILMEIWLAIELEALQSEIHDAVDYHSKINNFTQFIASQFGSNFSFSSPEDIVNLSAAQLMIMITKGSTK